MWKSESIVGEQILPYHLLPHEPVLGQEVCQGQGHGEGAQQEVRYGQVANEDVSGSQHSLEMDNFSEFFVGVTEVMNKIILV